MRMCSGMDMQDWGADAIYDVKCPHCNTPVEFFVDEITRRCHRCRTIVKSDRDFFGCGQSCSSSSPHYRSRCSKFRRSKARFYGHYY